MARLKRIAGTGVAAVALAFAAAGTAHAGGPYVSHGEPLRAQGGPYATHGVVFSAQGGPYTSHDEPLGERGDAYVVRGPRVGD